ncbi:F-box/LRR-repeat protein fbxl-1 [Anabrus simplex]|uniref:F-box/LRR-repeat protein fbxl-1 n=1 Tax=Anabrus simplex TaxID=316456 RepID=UPI0035A358AC
MAATGSAIDRMLPDEVLETVFSYCTHEDLVKSVQNVSSRWRRISQTNRLWKHIVYSPKKDVSDEQVEGILRISPKLQTVIFENQHSENVLEALAENCPELKKLVLCDFQLIRINFLKKLQQKCLKLEFLKIPDDVVSDVEMSKILGKFQSVKTLILTALNTTTDDYIHLKPVSEECRSLQHLEISNIRFVNGDLYNLMCRKKDTLHTLDVHCCNKKGECVLPLLAKAKSSALKSLCLSSLWMCQNKERSKQFAQLKTVTSLTLFNLLYVDANQIISIFENKNMEQLEELNIYGSDCYDDNVTDVVIENCPLIHTLTLDNCKRITDRTLKDIHKFKLLKNLTVFMNFNVTRKGLSYLKDIQGLRYLSVGGFRKLRHEGLKEIATLDKLEGLELCLLDLYEFPWNDFVRSMDSLKKLHISRCSVLKSALILLSIDMPHLKVSLNTSLKSIKKR